jgi:hypothetical protein
MKLKSYIANAIGANQTYEVQVRLAADASPGASYTLLGDLIHEPVDDNASGMQKQDISHVVYQHVQEQIYLKRGLQDMQRIKITYGGNFKPLQRVFIDQGLNRRFIGEEQSVTVTLDPVGATTDGVKFQFSNPALVQVLADTGNGVITFKSLQKGELFLRVRVGNIEQNIPFEFSEELQPSPPANVQVVAVAVAPTTANVAVGATVQLTPTVTPDTATNKAVTYTSSDISRATVSATGLVTGVASGPVTINVKTVDGNKAASSAITVTA